MREAIGREGGRGLTSSSMMSESDFARTAFLASANAAFSAASFEASFAFFAFAFFANSIRILPASSSMISSSVLGPWPDSLFILASFWEGSGVRMR